MIVSNYQLLKQKGKNMAKEQAGDNPVNQTRDELIKDAFAAQGDLADEKYPRFESSMGTIDRAVVNSGNADRVKEVGDLAKGTQVTGAIVDAYTTTTTPPEETTTPPEVTTATVPESTTDYQAFTRDIDTYRGGYSLPTAGTETTTPPEETTTPPEVTTPTTEATIPTELPPELIPPITE